MGEARASVLHQNRPLWEGDSFSQGQCPWFFKTAGWVGDSLRILCKFKKQENPENKFLHGCRISIFQRILAKNIFEDVISLLLLFSKQNFLSCLFTISEQLGHSGVLETAPVNKSTSGIGQHYFFFRETIYFVLFF